MKFTWWKKQEKIQKRNNVEVRYVGQNNKYSPIKNVDTAMKVSAFYRAISILADSVASKQLQYLRKDKQGFWSEEFGNIQYLLTHRPNSRFTSYTFINNMVLQMLLYGNAYIYYNKERNRD